jgi:predicted permease
MAPVSLRTSTSRRRGRAASITSGAPVTMTGTEETTRVAQMPVDVNGLSVVGVKPLLGRTYRLEDFDDVVKQKEARAIVVSYDTWQRRLGGAPDVIGKTIHVDGEPRSVIGVMPKGFRLLPWADDIAFWAANDLRKIPKATWMIAVGRLKPGVTPQQAEAESTVIARSVIESRGEKAKGAGTKVQTLRDAYFGGARRGLSFLLGAVSFVLLIACANVANMLLAAGAARQKELAVRVAAGAGRRRLMAQLLTENLLLSLAGCAFGLLLTFGGIRLFALVVPEGFPDLLRHNPIDLRVLAFALAISVFSSLLFGLIPALQASHVDVNDVLKEGGRGGSGTRRRGRSALLVAEVSLAMVLLLGAGLMMRGFMSEQSKLPGFSTERLVTGEVLLGGTRYFDKTPQDMNLVTPQVEVFYDQLLERVRALPGVEAAGFATMGILEGGGWGMGFTVDGFAPKPGDSAGSMVNAVSPGYLEVLQARIVRGRTFTEQDARLPAEGEEWPYRNAIVNETFVKSYFGTRDPIGRHVGIGGDPGTATPITIVGVVADSRYQRIREDVRPLILLPAFEGRGLNDFTVYVRSRQPTASVVANVRGVVRALDPGMPVFNVATLDERVARSLRNERLVAGLSAAFATLATLLGVVGLYGVMAYTVTRRSREIGIRMALGARAALVAGHVVREAGVLIVGGLLLSAPAAWWLKRYIAAELYGVKPGDPRTIALAAIGLVAIGLLAAAIPARRAARVSPMQALRDE